MWDFSIVTSIALVLRSFPFMVVRAAIYFGIAAAFVVAAGGGSGIGWAVGALAGPQGRIPGAFWGAIAGFAFVWLMLWGLREYFLYLVKAGHLAALVHLLDRHRRSNGQGQIARALGMVQQCFGEMHKLFTIDQLVRGSLRTLIGRADLMRANGTPAVPAATLLPFVGFTSEVVLAHPLRTISGHPWSASRDALVLFVQNHSTLFRNVLLLSGAAYGVAFVVFLAALGPALALAHAFPGGSTEIAVLLAAAFAWSFKQAFIEPFAMASMIQAYFRATKEHHPDPEWDARLTEASEHFRELKTRAAAGARTTRPPAARPA